MSSDNSDKFNRKKPSEDKGNSNVIDNEVRKLIKENPNNISQTAMYKLRERYGDQELLDQIQDSFMERTREVRKRARKFAKMINERYSNSNYPLHILLKKALKYKKKYNLSDPEFEEFRRVYEQTLTGVEEAQHVSVTVPFTNMSRALGQGMVDVDDGMKFDDKDYDSVQKMLRLYNETKAIHAQVVIQSMIYRDCASQALTGQYMPERHNPHCSIHPVIAAMFIPKIPLFDTHMLQANIAYIVKQRYTKQPILTSTDYDLFYDMISDPTDVVCSSESAVKDLYNRAQLQSQLWNSVISLRNGRYYDCNSTNFMLSIDNCRRHSTDSPDLMYEGDEGTVIQRLFGAFSLRPTIVATNPLTNVMSNQPMRTTNVMPKVTSIPMVTLRLPAMNTQHSAGALDLEQALHMSQWYVEDGNVVPRNQQIIYSRDVLVFYVPRRAHTLNIGQLIRPQQFHRLPRTVAGFDRINDTPITFENTITLPNQNHHYNLKSVVCVEINRSQEYTQNGRRVEGVEGLITGCSAIIAHQINDSDGVPSAVGETNYYWYNPRNAALGVGPINEGANPSESLFSPPITILNEFPASSEGEDFLYKAQRKGSIFIYTQDGLSFPDTSINF
jgi:hypothetical protein